MPEPDVIDQAIQRVSMQQIQTRLPTGRPAVIAVPADITPMEALAFAGWVSAVLLQKIAERPTSRLVLPS